MIELISNNNFNEKINSNEVVIVDFFAAWCGPCKLLSPIIDKIASNRSDVLFFKLNVDEQDPKLDNVARKNNVLSLPTVVIYKNGKELDRFVGFLPEQEIVKFINKAVK